jgi:DNA segregation ATPase FtsK/SpoIIIE-like protein
MLQSIVLPQLKYIQDDFYEMKNEVISMKDLHHNIVR